MAGREISVNEREQKLLSERHRAREQKILIEATLLQWHELENLCFKKTRIQLNNLHHGEVHLNGGWIREKNEHSDTVSKLSL